MEQEPLSEGLQAMMRDLPVEVQDAMALYRPHRLSDERWNRVREAVLALIPLTAPPSVAAFHKQMSPLIQFTIWTFEAGFPLDGASMVTPERVETWREMEHQRINKGQSLYTKATINDHVSRMRQMGPLINPTAGWAPKVGRVPGGVSKAVRDPYSDKELARLAAELHTMPEGPRKEQARAIWAMGLGFGPTAGEMGAMTGAMIRRDGDVVWADIPGSKERSVPVAAPHDTVLWELAATAGDGKLLVITAKHKNALGEAMRSITLGRKSAVLAPAILRTTWMMDRLRAGVDPRVVARYAGLRTLTTVMELLPRLPEPDPALQTALLRADIRDGG